MRMTVDVPEWTCPKCQEKIYGDEIDYCLHLGTHTESASLPECGKVLKIRYDVMWDDAPSVVEHGELTLSADTSLENVEPLTRDRLSKLFTSRQIRALACWMEVPKLVTLARDLFKRKD